MPIYTYECETCGYRFEQLAKFEDATHPCMRDPGESQGIGITNDVCRGIAKRVPSLPSPAQFNCSMPTYQRKKT